MKALWISQVGRKYIVSSDVDFGQSEELVTFGTRLDDFFQGEIHPGVAVHEMAIERFAILELHKHRMSLSSIQEPERKLAVQSISLLFL